MDEDNIKD